MARKKPEVFLEDEHVEEEMTPMESTPKPLGPIQRVKLANSLADILDNEQFKTLVSSVPNGKYILDLFIRSAEEEIERIMTGNNVSEEEVSAASDKVNSIVDSCMRLQEQLVALVKGRMAQQAQQQPAPKPQQPQQRQPAPQQPVRTRGVQPSHHQQQTAVRGNPIYQDSGPNIDYDEDDIGMM